MPSTPFRYTAMAGALLCALPLLATAAAATTPALPKGVTQGPSVEGITEYRLPNGLTVLLFPDASKPTITVNMTYLVGSRHENYGESGMAHLLEHLLFKGAPGYTDITKQFAARGMRFNGTTSVDRTNYFQSFKADEANLKWSIGMEAARMTKSFVAKKDLDSEMTVVRNEFESGENNPGNVLFKTLNNVAFDWQGSGRSTIGNRSDIENVRIENLQAFYRTYYQPDNAVLLVAGKFDPAKTLGMISQSFAAIPKPKRSLPVFWTVEPAQDGERSFTVRRKGDYQMVFLGYKSPSALHADRPALSVLAGILGDMPNGRLHKQLVASGKAVQVFAFGMSAYSPGLQVLGAVVKKDEPIEPVRDALIEAAESFTKAAPSAEEVTRIQRNAANDIENVLNDHERIGVALSEAIALGDWRLFFYQRDELAKVTPEQVAGAASRYFKRSNRVVGNFLPDDQPERVQIAAAPTASSILQGYEGKAALRAGEDFAPTTDNIDARTQHTTIGGLKVALLPKQTRGATVSVRLALHWGDRNSLSGKRSVGNLADGMLTRGTSRFTRQQLADEMQKLKISGGIYSFQTTREHLPAALRLVGHILKEPSFPAAELEELRKLMIVSAEAGRSEPGAVAARAKELHFNKYPKDDVRAATTIDEDIEGYKAVTLAEVQAYHRDFYGASQGEMAIVGDFDPAEASKVTQEVFGEWKSRAPYQRMPAENFAAEAKSETLNIPDKENAVYSARVNMDLRTDDPDYPALCMANFIFGQSGLKSRLMDRVRQKDGLSYGAGSGIWVSDLDRTANFSINAIAAPQNLAKIDAAVREELARAIKSGFTAEEVNDARKGILELAVQYRSQDNYVAGHWTDSLYLKRSFAWDKAIEEKIAKLTPAQVSAAFAKAVDPAAMSVFMAGDTAKAAGGGAKAAGSPAP